MAKHALLFDSDCGFCRWSVERIRRWDRRDALRIVAIQSAEGRDLLSGMDEDRRLGSWHLVSADGTIHSAGAATPELFDLLPGGKPLASLARLFPGATERLYRLVSRNRERLGRMLGEQACSVDPATERARDAL